MNGKMMNVLLVEDDEVDARIVKRAFREAKISNPLHVVKDGVEALAALRGNGELPFAKPHLILLDLNLPRMNGIEFLAELRADESLRDNVVFVFSTSNSSEDRAKAYQLNVAGYIVKSMDGEGSVDVVTMLDHYWRVVTLP